MPHLNELEILRSIPPDTLDSLDRKAKWTEFAKGGRLIEQGDTSTDVFFLHTGTLRVHLLDQRGYETTLRMLRKGEMFGEIAALKQAARTASVTAFEPSLVAIVSGRDFHDVMMQTPSFAFRVALRLCDLVISLGDRLQEQITMSAQLRFCVYILRRAKEAGIAEGEFVYTEFVRQAELASRAGASRENMLKALRPLRTDNLVLVDGKTVTVPDVARLAAFVRSQTEGDSD